MNFFKKALIATAVVASFGASAAKITPSVTALEISNEGIAANVAVPDAGFDFNIKAEALTAAASNLKVVFGAGVDLTTPKAAITGTVSQTNVNGVGVSTDGQMAITFGTGSFTFDNFVIDTTVADAHFITFDVSVGQPIAAGAAFNVAFSSGKVAKAATAVYTATDTGTVIDSGTGPISSQKDQLSFAVKTGFDALINRTNNKLFTDGTATDDLVLNITNDESLSRAVTTISYVADVSGAFTGVIVGEVSPVTDTAAGTITETVPVVDAGFLISGDAGTVFNTGAITTWTTTVDNNTTVIPETGATYVKFTATPSAGTPIVLAAKADSGLWKVDATIINVPYLPVGYTEAGIQSQVNLSNEGAADVDVIVTAIDNNGDMYGPVNLDTLAAFANGLPGETVTKLGENTLMDLLSAPAGVKLSVTFNIDANEGVVNGYAFTQKVGTGRTEISTSQQRGN